jgi:NAD(P)-dependent dehydrogenase (short-subunit alcohol dehydrogenase family)
MTGPRLDALADSRVVVVGGTSGIGLAVARQASHAGARVVVASRSESKLQRALEMLGPEASAFCVDVADVEGVQRFFQDLGPVDHVVSSIPSHTPVGSITTVDFEVARRGLELKVFGNAVVARAAAGQLRPHGSLTLVAAVSSRIGSANMALLGATNAAVEALGRGLAADLAPIRVNVISPGIVDTDYWAHLADDERDAMLARMAEGLPVGRVAAPDDVAYLVLAMMRSESVTGSVIDVDGGMLLH